jgi:thiosulfate dehydrogenase [quinone] large subunit
MNRICKGLTRRETEKYGSSAKETIMSITSIKPKAATQIPEPPIAKFFLADSRMAWLWLIVRLYVGYEWLTAGLEKLTGYSFTFDSTFGTHTGSSWIFGSHVGAAIEGFAKGGLTQASGAHPAVQSWYAWFLQNIVIPNAGFFAYLVTFGEVLVGVALILGLLTGIAAFFGLFMNMNYLLAGTVSTNPILGVLAILLVLAWRIAGYWGLDRYVLPLLGTPWTGSLARTQRAPVSPMTTQKGHVA